MLRNLLARTFAPHMERDLNKFLGKELATLQETHLLAPQVFGYAPKVSGGGAFAGTAARRQGADRLVKIQYPSKGKGLFE